MSLHGPYDTDNIFAKILRREIPAAYIATSSRTVAFMDAFPQSKGHCLVVPKMASRNMLEMARKDLSAVTDQVQVISKAVQKAFNPDGIIVTQFNGAAAGQTVFHTHFHIIPRYTDTALAGHGEAKMADLAELKALAAQIREQMP
jgi:histidine triad (HIT) family protein